MRASRYSWSPIYTVVFFYLKIQPILFISSVTTLNCIDCIYISRKYRLETSISHHWAAPQTLPPESSSWGNPQLSTLGTFGYFCKNNGFIAKPTLYTYIKIGKTDSADYKDLFGTVGCPDSFVLDSCLNLQSPFMCPINDALPKTTWGIEAPA